MGNFKKNIIRFSVILCIFLFSNSWQITASELSKDIYVLENSQIPLYDISNDIVAYYFTLNNGGYIITNSNGSDFIEYSLEKREQTLDKNAKYYYSGPCSLFKDYNNSTVENIFNNEKIELKELRSINLESDCNSTEALNLANDIISVSSGNDTQIIEQGKLEHSTKKYSYNPDGRCGAVAAAIVFRYYDDFIDTRYIKGSYKTASGTKLINLLVDKYTGKETNYTTLPKGLNKYLANRKITERFYKTTGINSGTVYAKIKSCINSNRPVIAGLKSHPSYGNHWVVGTGYSTVYSTLLGYGYVVIINDGWGNDNIRVNNAYIDGCLYIK